MLFAQVSVINAFHFLFNMVQFLPSDSVIIAWFPDQSVDSKLKVEKCILEDMFNVVSREGYLNGSEVDSMFWDDSIDDPGDGKQMKSILQVIKPGEPVGTQSRFFIQNQGLWHHSGLHMDPIAQRLMEPRKTSLGKYQGHPLGTQSKF